MSSNNKYCCSFQSNFYYYINFKILQNHQSPYKIWLTTLLNPFVWLGIKLIRFVQRAFDDDAYDLSLSNDFDGKYNVVSFEESIKRSV